MRILFEQDGLRCVTMFLDDFYLTREDQEVLAEQHPSNPMLQYRGNAGSHDMPLLMKTLKALRRAITPESDVRVPRYGKALHSGRGDRAPETSWEHIVGKVDVVLFEGWMLGFNAIAPADAVKLEDNKSDGKDRTGISRVNALLANKSETSYNAMNAFLDSWVVLQLSVVSQVFDWRWEAEQNQGNGLSNEEVRDFVERFMPAYEAYLPGLYEHGPAGTPSSKSRVLQIEVGKDRLPKPQADSTKEFWKLAARAMQERICNEGGPSTPAAKEQANKVKNYESDRFNM
jgi:D-glycerate 3-kinase